MYPGEKFNAVSHLIGAVLALVAAIALVVLATLSGDPWKLVSISIYVVTLVLLYLSSTLYHSLRGRAKAIMRELDHHCIYLFIAGTYTPFCLVSLRGIWGWSLLGVVWTLAAFGIWQEMRPNKGSRILSILIYMLMGWVTLAAIYPLVQALGTAGFIWLAVGGLLYTIGVVFYALNAYLVHAHGVWHMFVLAGSAAHYIAIMFYVL